MIRALLFDMGNVLIHFSHDRMCQQIGELVGLGGAEVRRELMDSGLFFAYELGELTSQEMHRAVRHLFGRPITQESLERATSDIFWRNESIEPVIDQLSATGLPLLLLSNTCEAHFRWVDARMPVLRRFPRRVLSFETHTCKPHSAIFHAAAHAAGVTPAECFFTDDTPGHVEAARQLGLDAVVYSDTPQLRTDLCVRGLLDVMERRSR